MAIQEYHHIFDIRAICAETSSILWW